MSVDKFWHDVMGHGPPWVPTHFLALGSISDFWGYQMLTWITGGVWAYVILSAPLEGLMSNDDE